jgi:ATP phosphoribosyltransferase regulatory subunit
MTGLLLQLLAACGPAERVLPSLLAIDLPAFARPYATRMADVFTAVRAYNATLRLTVDPVEFRGYQYHTGICITIFSPGHQAELGRGGRYLSGDTEPATGITLYPDTILRVAPAPKLRPRLYLPKGTPILEAERSREQGFATVAGLSEDATPVEEAVRLGCGHILLNGDITPIRKGPNA